MATALANLIDLERGRGAFDAELDTSTLAYAIIRISEGFLYADVVGDRAPDVGQAITVIQALLSASIGVRLSDPVRPEPSTRGPKHSGHGMPTPAIGRQIHIAAPSWCGTSTLTPNAATEDPHDAQPTALEKHP